MPEGVYVANVTPFKNDAGLSLDTDAYLAHVDWLSQRGVDGVVPFGTNGEGPSVTTEEKLAVLKRLFEWELPMEIIPTVAEGTLPETLRMIEALNDYPATAIMVLPPYYFKPVEVEGLARFYRPVLEASRHPVILYHIPKYAVPVPAALVAELPVWGVKDSGGEPGYAEEILASGKGVLLGTEDDLWDLMQTGAQGVISALANFAPEEIVEMRRRVREGDEAGGRALSKKLREVRAKTKEYAAPAALKKLADARHGVGMGTVRPPLLPAPETYDPRPVLEITEAF